MIEAREQDKSQDIPDRVINNWWLLLKHDAKHAPPLAPEQEQQLFIDLRRTEAWLSNSTDEKQNNRYQQQIEDIQTKIIASNVNLVRDIAYKYSRVPKGSPTQDILPDLVGAGLKGLYLAINGYDLTQGDDFGSYAFTSIKHAVQRERRILLNHMGLPEQVETGLQRIRRTADENRIILEFAQKYELDPNHARAVLSLVTSLEAYKQFSATSSKEQHFTADELIADGRLTPEEIVTLCEFSENIENALATLPSIEQQIIRLRFQTSIDGSRMSPEEIAKRLHITLPRARALLEDGIQRLGELLISKESGKLKAN